MRRKFYSETVTSKMRRVLVLLCKVRKEVESARKDFETKEHADFEEFKQTLSHRYEEMRCSEERRMAEAQDQFDREMNLKKARLAEELKAKDEEVVFGCRSK